MPTPRTLSYGSTFADSAGYLVNESSGKAKGQTEVVIDGGSGGIRANDIIRFAGDSFAYIVKVGVDGAAGTISLATGLKQAVSDDAAISVLSFTDVDEWLDEAWEPGDEEPKEVPYGDGTTGQDGVDLNGVAYVTGSNIPTAGTKTWLRYETDGSTAIIGGGYGCRIMTGKSGVRKHGEGPLFTCVKYSATGSKEGDTIYHG